MVRAACNLYIYFPSIPFDVLAHQIFLELCLASLLSCSRIEQEFVSNYIRIFASEFSKIKTESEGCDLILDDTFKRGPPSLLKWLPLALHYSEFSIMRPK